MAPRNLKIIESEEDKEMECNEKANSNKKIPPGIAVKICGVCGDKAFGYNFNAVTCESCKAFFRRNALASKEFRCPFTEQCEITVLTRRFCQKCRLEKCLSIGMVKEYIMSDEDKAQKRLKIAENRAKKRPGPKLGDDEVSSSKIIKREDNDDSNTSWTHTGKQSSPVSCEEQHSVESSDNVSANDQFDVPAISNNQAVSVIKNNNLSDSHIDSAPCDSNQFPPSHRKSNSFSASYESYSGENVLDSSQTGNPSLKYPEHVNHISSTANIIHHHQQGSVSGIGGLESQVDPMNLRFAASGRDDDNVMIRSMLTTPTPNSDTTRLFAALNNDHLAAQPLCDNTVLHNQQSKPNKADVARDILQDVESIHRIPVEPNSIESILCEAIKLEFEAYTSLSQINSSSRELNDAERAKLNELIVANKALLAPLDDHMNGISIVSDEYRFKPSQGQNDPTLLGIINLTAVAIRRLIKMSKKINAFKNMCEEDQVALLKGGCTEMMILRSTMTYDCARDTWKIPHSQEGMSNIKAEVLKLAKGNIYEEHDRFIRTFDPRWRMDENIILIICAIVLFTPDRPRVVHSDVIKLEQNSYYYLLRRYLESIYPGCEAKSTFLKLIQKIMELHKLADEVIGVYLDVNPSHVEPLLIEIFDLKQQH